MEHKYITIVDKGILDSSTCEDIMLVLYVLELPTKSGLSMLAYGGEVTASCYCLDELQIGQRYLATFHKNEIIELKPLEYHGLEFDYIEEDFQRITDAQFSLEEAMSELCEQMPLNPHDYLNILRQLYVDMIYDLGYSYTTVGLNIVEDVLKRIQENLTNKLSTDDTALYVFTEIIEKIDFLRTYLSEPSKHEEG